MAKYNVYLGGNKRVNVRENGSLWDAGLDSANQHVEYASHLKTRHKTMQFYYDDGHEHTRMFYRSHPEIAGGILPVNDELGVVLLAEGSEIGELVFHNKKPASGKVKVILNGTAGDSPVDVSRLQTAVDEAKVEFSKAVAESNAKPTDDKLKQAVTAKRTALENAEKALANATATEVMSFEVDLSKAGYTVKRVNKFLQTNGDITVKVIEGSLAGSCWTVSANVENHNDQHGCTCYTPPCETLYPDPMCTKLPA